MEKIDWKRKLSSRKFLAAVAGIVTGLAMIFGLDENTISTVAGAVVSVGSVVAYIMAEGKVDEQGVLIDTIRRETKEEMEAAEGVPGPQGPAGPQGPMGPAGPKGEDGVTMEQVESAIQMAIMEAKNE